MPKVEFDIWGTPFSSSDLQIVDLHWGDGAIDIRLENGKKLIEKANQLFKNIELQAQILDINKGSVYTVNFLGVNAFRLLDEHGLLEIWEERKKQKIMRSGTFKIKNHLWSKESPLSFHMANSDEFSHIIATDNECLEVICRETPKIELIRKI